MLNRLKQTKLYQWWHRQQHGNKYLVTAAVPERDGLRPIEYIGSAKTMPAAQALWNDYELNRKKIVHAQRHIIKVPWGRR